MNLFGKIKSQFDLLKQQRKQLEKLQSRVDFCITQVQRLQGQVNQIKITLGRIESRQLQSLNSHEAAANEFQVFSQWGEDGIIQFLLRHIPIKNKVFVEFGVQSYVESNTRFLLIHNNWSGLILDSSENNINYIKSDSIYWRYNLKAVQAFITKDNINHLISSNGVSGEIGLLSIDIDGNDYWVWDAINVVEPAIVIVEYNFRFGKEKAVTIPYDEQFIRSKAHYSMIYYGASLKALCLLAQRKGYDFVGSNTSGNNAFFVRKDLRPEVIQSLTPEEGYVVGQFREARDLDGKLSYLSLQEEEAILSSLPLVEVE
jgi:prefoldin subunit 5